jgi:hypothetical protein
MYDLWSFGCFKHGKDIFLLYNAHIGPTTRQLIITRELGPQAAVAFRLGD